VLLLTPVAVVQAEVTDVATGKTWYFAADCWLDASQGDKAIEQLLPASDSDPWAAMTTYKVSCHIIKHWVRPPIDCTVWQLLPAVGACKGYPHLLLLLHWQRLAQLLSSGIVVTTSVAAVLCILPSFAGHGLHQQPSRCRRHHSPGSHTLRQQGASHHQHSRQPRHPTTGPLLSSSAHDKQWSV
jgi:hypothetical protein